MAIARAKLVDLTVTRWYHCVSRCVRKAFLLGEGDHNRREWLEELGEIFAVAVGGFAVMHNHLHVLLRLESRRNWLGSSSGWVLLPRASATRWAISGATVCWAASLRPAASNYGQSPNSLVCGIWSTWSVVRCVETIPDLETGRSAVARSPGPHA